jgi:hypothetical protein
VKLTSQKCGFYGPTVHPQAIAMWTMVWWYWLRLTLNLSTRALWQPPVLSGGPVSRDISGACRRTDEGNGNLVYPSLWDFKRSLTCHKILWHGTSSFTSHPKEGVLWIFITFKNPSPWPGLNPSPLGLVASTLTTTHHQGDYHTLRHKFRASISHSVLSWSQTKGGLVLLFLFLGKLESESLHN